MSFDLWTAIVVAVIGSAYVLIQELDNWVDDSDPYDSDDEDLGAM